MNEKFIILTPEERELLPTVLLRRNKFRNVIIKCITLRKSAFSNAIFIQGRAGTGKTTLITEFLETLKEDRVIEEYSRVCGHVTQSSLYEFLKTDYDMNIVHVLDDVDCLYDGGCLELLKSALDTKNSNKDNRHVYYSSRGVRNAYKYSGFLILITNDKLENPSPHLQAVLDRVHMLEMELEPGDFFIFNNHLVEKYLNENPDSIDEKILQKVADFYNNTVREWFNNDVFSQCNLNFSIRMIKKFIDLIVWFDDSWKDYSIEYKKLTNKNNEIKSKNIQIS